MDKILFFLLITVFVCLSSSQVFFNEDIHTPDPQAVHCINRTQSHLSACDVDAKSHWIKANHTQMRCCYQWESIQCGHKFIMDMCNKTEIEAIDFWIMEFISDETKGECNEYTFRSKECQRN